MATARPFAYNPPPNALIAGTEQVGALFGMVPNGLRVVLEQIKLQHHQMDLLGHQL